MKDKTAIAGGVLEIIAGGLSLVVALMAKNIYDYAGYTGYDWANIIVPILFILFGIFACTGKRKKSDLVTYGILNLAFVGLQIFGLQNYVGLGIVQIVLLAIASLLFFTAKGKPKNNE